MLQNLLYIVFLLAGFPTGLILAKLCKEEIKNWKNRFIIITGISLIAAIVISFSSFQYKIPIILTLFFIIITFLTIIWKTN